MVFLVEQLHRDGTERAAAEEQRATVVMGICSVGTEIREALKDGAGGHGTRAAVRCRFLIRLNYPLKEAFREGLAVSAAVSAVKAVASLAATAAAAAAAISVR
jgi:hypothetical protein